ncbi:MAG: PIG-L family deacetylase [Planctomycetes bacterium]|jgi:LmbE family N-acetylglucosaminyl deacetylase|nr:PIG-L family deacetylase [Planctomycetota bacterium]
MHRRVLILAPHADDGELGCGGTAAKFVEEGREVHMAVFSLAEKSVPPPFPRDALLGELSKAADVLGIPRGNLHVFRFEVRDFPSQRQAILEEIVGLRDRLAPDLVFVPSLSDIHQDHQVVAREGLRAFKRQTVLGFEEPWNNIIFETRAFVVLEERHVDRKVAALACYETQRARSYLDESFIRSLARTRGTQLESRCAEAFEVLRLILP